MLPDLHIVFDDSAAGTLKSALRDLGVVAFREKVIAFPDVFSIGPVWQLHEKSGQKNRLEWLNTHLTHEPVDNFAEWYVNSFEQALERLRSIGPDAMVALWSGDNAHEQTGLRFALYLLGERKNELFVADATKASRESHPNYVPLSTGEMSPEAIAKFIEENQIFQPLQEKERKRLKEEWASLAKDRAVLRIWQAGKIRNVSEDYFDERLIRAAKTIRVEQEQTDFIKAARLIGEVLGHLDQYVGDQYLEYRLRQLIHSKKFLVEGSLEAMRYYSVKLHEEKPE